MKYNEKWLSEWVQPDIAADDLLEHPLVHGDVQPRSAGAVSKASAQGVYAIKEIPPFLAKHEFDTLRAMEDVPKR